MPVGSLLPPSCRISSGSLPGAPGPPPPAASPSAAPALWSDAPPPNPSVSAFSFGVPYRLQPPTPTGAFPKAEGPAYQLDVEQVSSLSPSPPQPMTSSIPMSNHVLEGGVCVSQLRVSNSPPGDCQESPLTPSFRLSVVSALPPSPPSARHALRGTGRRALSLRTPPPPPHRSAWCIVHTRPETPRRSFTHSAITVRPFRPNPCPAPSRKLSGGNFPHSVASPGPSAAEEVTSWHLQPRNGSGGSLPPFWIHILLVAQVLCAHHFEIVFLLSCSMERIPSSKWSLWLDSRIFP